jgi:hypothetical protein
VKYAARAAIGMTGRVSLRWRGIRRFEIAFEKERLYRDRPAALLFN